MGKKLYEKTESGGVRFKSERKPWEVRMPCYIYDLWLPLIGAKALGTYGLYCRLGRQRVVKAITLQSIADACRVGKATLYKINEKLALCRFITVTVPTGWQRLAHFTTEITVLDPPAEVPPEIIAALLPNGREYKPLTPWLVEERPEVLGGTSEEVLGGTSNVVTLGLEPLDVVLSEPNLVSKAQAVGYTPGPGKLVSCVDPDTDEEIGEENWREPSTQMQANAFSAVGRERFWSKAERQKLERIERMFKDGELSLSFWKSRIRCAQEYGWSLKILLKSTLNPNNQREWEMGQRNNREARQ